MNMERINWKPWAAVSRRKQLAGGQDEATAVYQTTPDKVTTYRAGTKWLRPELVGQRVEFFDEGAEKVFATAEVVAVKVTRFGDIDAVDHCRQSGDMTVENRLKIMQSVYGADFNENSLTTVVTLGRIEVL
jgi:hypothetical protein